MSWVSKRRARPSCWVACPSSGGGSVRRNREFAYEPGHVAGAFQREIEVGLLERLDEGVIRFQKPPGRVAVFGDLLLGKAPQRQFARRRYVPEGKLVVTLEVEVRRVAVARRIVEQLVERLLTILEELLEGIAKGFDRLLSDLPMALRAPGHGRTSPYGDARESRERASPAPRGFHE